MNDSTTQTAAPARSYYCSRCSVEEVSVPGDRCSYCEAKHKTEVEKLLGNHGHTIETVPTSGSSADTPVTPEEDEWFAELEKKSKAASEYTAPVNASLLPDEKIISDSLTTARENTKTAGVRITNELVPEMGSVLTRIDSTALAFGFPPAVDTLIKKTQLMPEAANDLLAKFRDMFTLTGQMRSELHSVDPQSVDDVEAIAKAKELHKIIRDERLNAEKRKKLIKEPYLRPSQLIDGVFKIWTDEIGPLEAEAKFKAEFVENLEKARKATLSAERAGKLALFEVTDVAGFNLGEITDAAFEILYQGAMSSYQARQAEKQRLERERVDQLAAYEAEQARLRAENERLAKEKAEADAREAQAREREEIERKAKEQAEAEIRRNDELRLAEERRLAAEAEAKRLADEAEAEARRLAPDKEKLGAYFQSMHDAAVLIPTDLESEKAKQLAQAFFDSVADLVNRYSARAAELK